MDACPMCGRPGTQLSNVLAVVRERGEVTPDDVAEHLDMPKVQANKALCRLVDKGSIARVHWGLYSADDDGALRRLALQQQIHRLTPA